MDNCFCFPYVPKFTRRTKRSRKPNIDQTVVHVTWKSLNSLDSWGRKAKDQSIMSHKDGEIGSYILIWPFIPVQVLPKCQYGHISTKFEDRKPHFLWCIVWHLVYWNFPGWIKRLSIHQNCVLCSNRGESRTLQLPGIPDPKLRGFKPHRKFKCPGPSVDCNTPACV